MVVSFKPQAPVSASLTSLVRGFILTQRTDCRNSNTIKYYEGMLKRFLWHGEQQNWTEDTRHPFFIRVDGILAGFILISEYTYLIKEPGTKSITEFFIMRKYRRKGIGKSAATQIFDRFPGKWEVIQHGGNEPSKIFWEAVIREYTNGNYRQDKVKTEWWEGRALIFDNSK